jgi:hypothetical protein
MQGSPPGGSLSTSAFTSKLAMAAHVEFASLVDCRALMAPKDVARRKEQAKIPVWTLTCSPLCHARALTVSLFVSIALNRCVTPALPYVAPSLSLDAFTLPPQWPPLGGPRNDERRVLTIKSICVDAIDPLPYMKFGYSRASATDLVRTRVCPGTQLSQVNSQK